jgi:hypothetical protein
MPKWVRIPLLGVPGTHLDWLKSLAFHCYDLLFSIAYSWRKVNGGYARDGRNLVFLSQDGLTHYGLATIGGSLRE